MAPLRSITRTVTRNGPEPKDARTAGAQAVARLLPNRLRTAGVSTTTAELVGTSEFDLSTNSSREGNPCALSAAHIAGSQETLTSRLTCWATQEAAAARASAAWRAAAALVGLPAGERPKYLTPATASTPTTRTTATNRATRRDRAAGRRESAGAGPAGGLTGGWGAAANGGLTADGGLTEDGGLVLVPSHSVISSSAIGPAFAALGRTGRTGSGLVASPPGASSCLVAAPERSAVTAARMRCRSSSESTEEDEGAAGGRTGPGRAPDALRQFPAGLLLCHSGHPPVQYAYRAIRPHGIAQHRMSGYSSRTMKCNSPAPLLSYRDSS